jgi:hypothetical protein
VDLITPGRLRLVDGRRTRTAEGAGEREELIQREDAGLMAGKEGVDTRPAPGMTLNLRRA